MKDKYCSLLILIMCTKADHEETRNDIARMKEERSIPFSTQIINSFTWCAWLLFSFLIFFLSLRLASSHYYIAQDHGARFFVTKPRETLQEIART